MKSKIIKDLKELNEKLSNQYRLRDIRCFHLEIENLDLQQRIDKAIQFIKEHNKNAGKLYYKYNNKYLLSEIKEDLLEILGVKNGKI